MNKTKYLDRKKQVLGRTGVIWEQGKAQVEKLCIGKRQKNYILFSCACQGLCLDALDPFRQKLWHVPLWGTFARRRSFFIDRWTNVHYNKKHSLWGVRICRSYLQKYMLTMIISWNNGRFRRLSGTNTGNGCGSSWTFDLNTRRRQRGPFRSNYWAA